MANSSISAEAAFPTFSSKIFWATIMVLPMLSLALPRTMGFAPAIATIILVLVSVLLKDKRFYIPRLEIALYCGLGIIVFSGLYWAENLNFALERALKISGITLMGLILLSWARGISLPKKSFGGTLFVVVYALFALFLSYEQKSGFQITSIVLDQENLTSEKLNRSFVIFSLFFVPVLFLIKNLAYEKKYKIGLMAVVFTLSFITFWVASSQTAQLSLIVGALFFFIYPIKNRILFYFLSGSIIVGFLIFPFIVKPAQQYLENHEAISKNHIIWQASIPHRLEIWSYSADEMMKSPVYGHGLEALRFMKADHYMKTARTDNVLHSHNVALQIWVEFGMIGALFSCLLIFYILHSIWKTENLEVRKLYLSVFMACLSCSMTGYGFWQSWQLGLFLMLATFCVTIGRQYQSNLK